jgi:hypothetical protein
VAIPDYQAYMLPLLKRLADGKEHKFSELVHDIITTLFTRSWLLALAGAAVIGAQSVSAQTTE